MPGAPSMSLSSSNASVPTILPSASRGRKRCFCSALPYSRTAADASDVEIRGEGNRPRPVSSNSTTRSTQPSPEPPNSSGIASPSQPSSAISAHSGSASPSGDTMISRTFSIGACSSRKRLATRRSTSCSSVRPKFTRSSVSCESICSDRRIVLCSAEQGQLGPRSPTRPVPPIHRGSP